MIIKNTKTEVPYHVRGLPGNCGLKTALIVHTRVLFMAGSLAHTVKSIVKLASYDKLNPGSPYRIYRTINGTSIQPTHVPFYVSDVIYTIVAKTDIIVV